MEGQADEDGLNIPDEVKVAEATLAKNCTINIGGFSTPQQGVLGQQPPLLADLEPGSLAVADDSTGPDFIRDSQRVREISVAAAVQETANRRLQNALDSRTRPSLHFRHKPKPTATRTTTTRSHSEFMVTPQHSTDQNPC